ncbi:E3 ubiquitin-protein ligase TRIM35-like [Garra rufa]|uniref:E3 ubiquitin-protein ligase TRIM35-like n=1 Tax=Garra rufa TaxID=137080 RepID=UPI003CCE6180
MDSQSVDELSCPVCFDIFKTPVLLSCSHSVCKACLQQFWKTKNTQECPVCRRRSSKEEPPYNLALKNLCELFLRDRRQEEVCSSHNEKLKLFCLTDKEPVCLVCRDSQKHTHHTFQPIDEVVPPYKEELKTSLKSLREKLKYREEIKGEYNKTVQHMKTQVEHTELQIKQEFKKLHQFLSDEEQATITALRNEEEKKNQMMKEKLEKINRHISALSNTIKDIEDRMKANDVSFLKNFNVTKERAGITQPDPEKCCGALIDVPHYLGNLPFRVWKKMQDIVQNTPVVLDPNTASPQLLLSADLTRLTYNKSRQPLPDNPERFDFYRCVLGSEGFRSGAHCWDVEVGNNSAWTVGIIAASYQRKGDLFFKAGVWYVQYTGKEYISQSPEQHAARFPVREKLRLIRVQLDLDNGNMSFSDPVTNTQLRTFKTTFKETLFPFFQSICEISPLRIVPLKVKISSI